MLIEPSLVIGTATARHKTRLSFLFKDLDGTIVALSSSWLTTVCKPPKIDITAGEQKIGTGEITALEPDGDALGPQHCGFVFRLDRSCTIAAAFALGGEMLPVRSIGEAIGHDVFLGSNAAVSAGSVLPHYDEATLTICGSKRRVFPLLAVASEDIEALRKRYGILSGAMLYDEDNFLIGLIVGLAGSRLLVASVVDIMESFNFSPLLLQDITEWNREAENLQRRRARGADVAPTTGQIGRTRTEPRIPSRSALDRLEQSATV